MDRSVEFRCRHEELLAYIVWKLNGTSSRAYIDVVDFFVRENGVRVNTLTVPVIPAYNGTEVVCSTTINGVTEETPAALLIITGEQSIVKHMIVLMYIFNAQRACAHEGYSSLFVCLSITSLLIIFRQMTN